MEKSLEPSIITVLGTVVFRVIWLLTVFKMVPTYEMLMNVYVASWIFTGGLLLLIYLKHMRKLEKKAISSCRILVCYYYGGYHQSVIAHNA